MMLRVVNRIPSLVGPLRSAVLTSTRYESTSVPAVVNNASAGAISSVKEPAASKAEVKPPSSASGGSTFGQRVASFLVGTGVGFG